MSQISANNTCFCAHFALTAKDTNVTVAMNTPPLKKGAKEKTQTSSEENANVTKRRNFLRREKHLFQRFDARFNQKSCSASVGKLTRHTSNFAETPNFSASVFFMYRINKYISVEVALSRLMTKPACFSDTCAPPTR